MPRKKTIKATTLNNTTYEGSVTLKIKGANNKITKTIQTHNAGTKYFFYGIAFAISGEILEDYLPHYISAGDGTLVEGVDVEVDMTGLKHEISSLADARPALVSNYKSPQYTNDGGVTVMYQGVIPYNLVLATPISELGLFGTNQGASLLARIQLDESITLDPGDSLIVEWTFKLANKTQETQL